MAKKRKAARPAASRAKKTTRKTARKPVRRTAVATKPLTGLESNKHVNFGPLKTQIRAHIERLSSAKVQSPAVQNALRSLREVQSTLTGECSPTMVIPTQ